MGAGSSVGVGAAIAAAKPDELTEIIKQLPAPEREKLMAALGGLSGADKESVEAAAEMTGAVDWEAMFAHKGDYEPQREKFGPAPDFTSPETGWYWYGQDGSTGPELAPRIGGDKPTVSERPADVFYIHPTSYSGPLWNMPLDDKEYRHVTDFYVACEASAFNGSCRLFVPKFRQAVIAAMGIPEEGKLATELAYADVKKAFEHYLANENKGRPFFLASHSQGSLYSIRLMVDFIEGKPLFSQFVACYGIAAWAPLSLFEGPAAVFNQIKVCRSSTDLGCFISWTCEHPDTVKQHGERKDSKEPGDWYPQMGHKITENEWRLAHGEPIVCTDPLTWVSNGLGDPDAKPEEWLGMLNVFANEEHQDMDTISGLMYTPHGGLQLKEPARMMPDEFNSKFEDGATKLVSAVDQKTGDLQLVPLPVAWGGSMTESYEHMNFLLFWFNIRKNIALRMEVKAQ